MHAADMPGRRFSRAAVTLTIVFFGLGVALGGLHYLSSTGTVPEHDPSQNAWGPHLALAAILVLVGIGYGVFRRRLPPLLAPLGAPAAARVAAAFRGARSPGGILRCAALSVIGVMMLYLVVRMGMQVLGGLDPNFVVNAWGGPTYLGAMFCHLLDAAVVVVASGCLAHVLLPPRAADERVTSKNVSAVDSLTT